MTREDVDKAFAILRSWKAKAQTHGKIQLQTDVAHLERVLQSLTGRKR